MAEETVGLISGPDPDLDPAERRLLAAMPLHAISSVHGQAGLRERLLMEIERFPAADRGRARDALALAGLLHAADRRQREPYANHLLRVTIRILSHYRVTDPDVTCAALLHDAVEDHAADISPGGRQAALAVLAGRFGDRTAALVAAVTNPGWEPGRDEHEQYREHVLASLAASPWAGVIKASDFTDNAVGIIHLTGPKLARLARQVRTAGTRPARAHPAPGHPAGDRRQGHDRRPVRRRPGTVRRHQARPTREQWQWHRPASGRTAGFLLAANGRPLCRDRTALTHLNGRRRSVPETSRVAAKPIASMSRVCKPRTALLVDLFDGQSSSQGGWVMPDVAGCGN